MVPCRNAAMGTRPVAAAAVRRGSVIAAAAAAFGIAMSAAHAAREPVDDADLQQAVAAFNSRVDLESQELVCKREAPVGTRIKKTVCRNKGLIDREQRDAKRFVNKPRPVPTQE